LIKRPSFILLLAHHNEKECHHKCFQFRYFPGKSIYLCSRCSGLYPVLILTLILDFLFFPKMSSLMRSGIFWGLNILPWLHWAKEHFSQKPFGSKWVRYLTGIPAGIGTGILFADHFVNPWNYYFTTSLIFLGLITFCVVYLESFFRE
jgi:uncharacterized membrane protein